MRSSKRLSILFLMLSLISLACVRNAFSSELTDDEKIQRTASVLATQAAKNPVRKPGEPAPSPTPDAPHSIPTLRSDPEKYFAKQNDTYGKIAAEHGVSLQDLIEENDILDENMLLIGQEIDIPVAKPAGQAPAFKIIPDSELVYGPTTVDFSAAAFMEGRQGYLTNYSEKIDDVQIAGVEIINKVARDYSVNPRLLMVLLEYMGGWVTNPRPASEQITYPLGYEDPAYKGLYKQLSFAANNLNKGFYLYQSDALSQFILLDGSFITPNPTVNAGTVGVQYFFSKVLAKEAWEKAITDHGFIAQYQFLFEYPFDLAYEPLLPRNLNQPDLQLPFEDGVKWSFTAGPHASWDYGAAWGALDFAPPGDMLGCKVQMIGLLPQRMDKSYGQIMARSFRIWMMMAKNRLDGRCFICILKPVTGWSVELSLKPATDIGHPSCEGGVSTGTHLHFARRYNGTWIAADGNIPFVMDGWISSGRGMEYDGELTRENNAIEAWDGRKPENQIKR